MLLCDEQVEHCTQHTLQILDEPVCKLGALDAIGEVSKEAASLPRLAHEHITHHRVPVLVLPSVLLRHCEELRKRNAALVRLVVHLHHRQAGCVQALQVKGKGVEEGESEEVKEAG